MLPAALVAAIIPVFFAEPLDYLGSFAGKVEIRSTPLPGYYYSPTSMVPLKTVFTTVPITVKVFDGGSICPSLTRYKTYLYSPSPLPGYYLIPEIRRPHSRLHLDSSPMPLSSLGRWP